MSDSVIDRSSLRPVHDDNGPWSLHDAAATRVLEAAALSRAAPQALMERAGLAVARLALAMAPHRAPFLVMAGPGNNGGDGLVAARHLHLAGQNVAVCLLADPARLPSDARLALQAAQACGVPLSSALPSPLEHGLVIDALLGLGTSRPVEGAMAEVIRCINTGTAKVLSVDLPSGLDGDRGQALGGLAVQASATLSLLTLKPGLFTGAGRDHAGAVWFDALGSDTAGPGETTACARLSDRADAVAAYPPRTHATHKGSFGDVAVVGGAAGMRGAASLAAGAALAAGAGRVFVSPLDAHAAPVEMLRPEIMVRPDWWRSASALRSDTVVVCGCGGGESVREALPALLGAVARLVLDADALNAIAADPALRTLLLTRAARGHATVLTPHPLEAARLLDTTTAEVQAHRLAAAQMLADRHHCVVVLKGSGSVIAEPQKRPIINSTGNALLASAGTGDVLAGWLGGTWAALGRSGTPGAAAVGAVWLHGHAADRVATEAGSSLPLRAADLIEHMRRVVPR